ncbi:hypothetical protein HanRHA438_Chr02g0065301 [Helianthus annuus]|nr:hypothetical protein HanHA300_Chr02g0052601 [Helianthus annuus]KAJ0939796.1 hypothetical protein HanRHA438_Chr02g0065301 [Helianthus annuus]
MNNTSNPSSLYNRRLAQGRLTDKPTAPTPLVDEIDHPSTFRWWRAAGDNKIKRADGERERARKEIDGEKRRFPVTNRVGGRAAVVVVVFCLDTCFR